MLTKIKSKKKLLGVIEAYKFISNLPESDLETLEILSNKKDFNLIQKGINESKNNKVHPIESLL